METCQDKWRAYFKILQVHHLTSSLKQCHYFGQFVKLVAADGGSFVFGTNRDVVLAMAKQVKKIYWQAKCCFRALFGVSVAQTPYGLRLVASESVFELAVKGIVLPLDFLNASLSRSSFKMNLRSVWF